MSKKPPAATPSPLEESPELSNQDLDSYDELSGVFDSPISLAEAVDRSNLIAGRYEIIERIGAGGMGQVVHVRHVRLGKSFALKLMQAENILNPEATALFRSEARLASTLCHPNIVSVVDFGEDPDWGFYIAMEFLQGESLSERIATTGALPLEVVCQVGIQIASALQHSHEHLVVHGDIKSENVLCVKGSDSWEVKLLDFGTAKSASGSAAKDELISGTPEYMAPERIQGNPPAPSNDIYALGVVIYEMLTGRALFVGDDPTTILHQHLNEIPEPAGALRGEVLDQTLDEILSKALDKNPDERFACAADLAEALNNYLSEKGARQRESEQRVGFVEHTRDEAAADAFNALGIAAAGIHSNGTIRVVNQALAKLLRADSVDELEGRTILDTPLVRLHPDIREDLRLVAMEGHLIRRRLTTRTESGQEVVLRLTMSPTHGRGGSCILVLHALRKGVS